ncbi:MAG: DUF116 domain-containing protein [Candidatus Bathyarchaeota archaeon]|nr:DUF116 domain-containing protein [Candidatus Bathyarchaeota archaeon]MCX8177401.1 DUF116 domain-containing protein [Candidatus Bathyarchaeota archaeon]MDW8193848.1 DUF116 domain-containing protein [Nitrososphaerota archaeon]
MPYKFTFDLSRIPQLFFTELTKISYDKGIHRRMGIKLRDVIKKFRIQEATGLNLSDAIQLLEDLIDMEARNLLEMERFGKASKKALFLPHCSRKYMDSRCKAEFNSDVPTYLCAKCSPDCLINKATSLAKNAGYDVYILPGGSCISKILKLKRYDGIVGVACGEELRVAEKILENMNIAGQAVPLLKNGCSNTFFNIETLQRILEKNGG